MKKTIRIVTVFILVIYLLSISATVLMADTKTVDMNEVKNQLNQFISDIKADGRYDKYYDFWIVKHNTKALDYSALTGENGHLNMGTTSQQPFSYINNGERTGFTIEIIYNFCMDYGYSIEFQDYSATAGLITSIQAGRCDFGGGNSSITEERKKQVDFSDPFFDNRTVIVVKDVNKDKYSTEESLEGALIGTITGSSLPDRLHAISENINVAEYNTVADCCKALDNNLVDGVCYDEAVIALAMDNYKDQVISTEVFENDQFAFVFRKTDKDNDSGILGSLKSSIERNFIEGQRYKLILRGLYTTFIIATFSIIFGTALGFLIYVTTREDNKLISIVNWIIDGLPAVVLLMILYYVVFGKVGLNGIIVSIIAFSLIFSNSTLSLLRSSVGAIDKGQFEVSYALGFKKKEAFYKMILPQAISIAKAGYKGAVINIIKATAIVGYIAEQDLTKAGDMIRSSTFEAFFPLIVVALLYFLLAWIMVGAVDILAKALGPSEKKSEKFLKGVKR